MSEKELLGKRNVEGQGVGFLTCYIRNKQVDTSSRLPFIRV